MAYETNLRQELLGPEHHPGQAQVFRHLGQAGNLPIHCHWRDRHQHCQWLPQEQLCQGCSHCHLFLCTFWISVRQWLHP